jgi:hypothetical protein
VAAQRTQLSGSVVLDATGAGQVQLFTPGPSDLVVTLQTLSTTTAVKVPTGKIYRNAVTDANFLEGSYTASNDSSDTRIVLYASESLICLWTGGDPGATATYRISGVLYSPGQAPAE